MIKTLVQAVLARHDKNAKQGLDCGDRVQIASDRLDSEVSLLSAISGQMERAINHEKPFAKKEPLHDAH